MLYRYICALLALVLLVSPALALERSELRALWNALSESQAQISPYAEAPDLAAFASGSLTSEAQQNALDCLNLLRSVAGLDQVSLSPLYSLRAQHGAMLLAANDELTHQPERPDGMNPDVYETALAGTSMGNIAKFNWMRPEILIDGVRYFARDDGPENLAELGHRRWLLNPQMAQTGFGLAHSASGMSYVTMYAVDSGNAGAEWNHVAWPAAGCFPVELMRAALPWSVSLNPEIYDVEASQPWVLLKEEISGAEYIFEDMGEGADGFFNYSQDACGTGPCIIFRPNVDVEYVQNQRWSVRIGGLKLAGGEETSLNYICEMVSLYPQDVVNVEMSLLEAEMEAGESLQLAANVVPAYADDLAVAWNSSDASVATVDKSGLVTAVGAGSCEITAASANGRSDFCVVTVG